MYQSPSWHLDRVILHSHFTPKSFHLGSFLISAYFSGTDGCQLLTTDQHNEIRVYQSPSWHLDRVILHSHFTPKSFHLGSFFISAYFSGTDGCQLLTTDQHNELRVYQSPSWHLDRVILHSRITPKSFHLGSIFISAYFSGTDGCQLLTNDQHNELRVYQSPSWHLERVILHSHITPFTLVQY